MAIHIPTNKTELFIQWAVVVLATYGAIRLAEDIADAFDEHAEAKRSAEWAASFKKSVRGKPDAPVRLIGPFEYEAVASDPDNEWLRSLARDLDEGRRTPIVGELTKAYVASNPGVTKATRQSLYDTVAHVQAEAAQGRDWFTREDVDTD